VKRIHQQLVGREILLVAHCVEILTAEGV